MIHQKYSYFGDYQHWNPHVRAHEGCDPLPREHEKVKCSLIFLFLNHDLNPHGLKQGRLDLEGQRDGHPGGAFGQT